MFPQLQNQNIQFLPQNFYDAKIRTTIPILNTDIGYNNQIQKQQIQLTQYELDVYKRDLVRDLKTAYYNYLNALRAIEIFESSLLLANESKRVNEKLLDNGKGVPAYLLRASSEIEHVTAQIVNAREQSRNAQMYFNFLRNQEPETPIDTAFNATEELEIIRTSLHAEVITSGREELKMLQQLININETVVRLNKAFLVPKLNGFLDLGSQASNWEFNNQSRYYMVGLQLDFPIFTGLRNTYKIRQAKLDAENTSLQMDLARQKMNLSGQSARNNLSAAYQNLQSSQKQLESAATYQRLIEKGYREGVNTFIETIDARNQLTLAEMAVTMNHFKLLSAYADLERETSSYQIQ
jgi:outer membrane protein TolC